MQQLIHTIYNSIHWNKGVSSEEKKSSELEKEFWINGYIIWQQNLKVSDQGEINGPDKKNTKRNRCSMFAQLAEHWNKAGAAISAHGLGEGRPTMASTTSDSKQQSNKKFKQHFSCALYGRV